MDMDKMFKIACVLSVATLAVSVGAIYMASTPEHHGESETYVLYIGMGDREMNDVQGIEDHIKQILSQKRLAYTHWIGNGGAFSDGQELLDDHTLVYKFVNAEKEPVMEIVDMIHHDLRLTVFMESYYSHDSELLIPAP